MRSDLKYIVLDRRTDNLKKKQGIYKPQAERAGTKSCKAAEEKYEKLQDCRKKEAGYMFVRGGARPKDSKEKNS